MADHKFRVSGDTFGQITRHFQQAVMTIRFLALPMPAQAGGNDVVALFGQPGANAHPALGVGRDTVNENGRFFRRHITPS